MKVKSVNYIYYTISYQRLIIYSCQHRSNGHYYLRKRQRVKQY